MATKQPVNINGIEFDALLNEEYAMEASSPEYIVESGYTIGDSIILSAENLSMTLYQDHQVADHHDPGILPEKWGHRRCCGNCQHNRWKFRRWIVRRFV